MPLRKSYHAPKTRKGRRFSFAGLEIEEMPQFNFSVISQTPIEDITRRELLRWLVGRNGFRKLQIHQPDFQECEFNCVFTQTGLRYINGNCHGINLTVSFDSQYAYGITKMKTISSDGSDWVKLKLINDSDILDDYIYPVVRFAANDLIDDKSIVIINSSDRANPHRAFEYGYAVPTEIVEFDNELKIITSNIGGDKLGQFNLNWLRLMRGAMNYASASTAPAQLNGQC